jgi:hypothetical protein
VREQGLSLPNRPVVGVLHPGMMGTALGSALKPAAGVVIWAAAGRSITTSRRAEMADLVSVPDLNELARRADLIVSVCPPDAALAVATEVAAALVDRPGRTPLYLDANAVAPDTVRAIGELLGPDRVVDGSIIGPPPWEPGHTVLWLSGPAASTVAELFAELARMGAEESLLDDPEPRAVANAWRWAGEMDEAAAALDAVGVPDGFSRAAAQMYRRLAAQRPVDRANEWGLRGTAT